MRMKDLGFGVQEGHRWVWRVRSSVEELLTLSAHWQWCSASSGEFKAQHRTESMMGALKKNQAYKAGVGVPSYGLCALQPTARL